MDEKEENIMDAETQKQLLDAAQRALAIIATTRKHKTLVYELRDIIRKVKGHGPE